MPLVNAVKSRADLGASKPEQPANPFTRQVKLSFDQKYPRIDNPLKLNEHQLADLMPRLGFSTVGNNEVQLAISRTPTDTEFSNVASFASDVIRLWRSENADDSDAAASRKLLDGSSSLAAIDGKLEAAKLAQAQAEQAHRDFEKAYYQFRGIPGQYSQLTSNVANLEAERRHLIDTDFDAKIRQLIEIELNPRPGLIVAESVPSLLMIRDTRELRLQVIDDLVTRMKAELVKLADNNRRLAKELDLPAHTI